MPFLAQQVLQLRSAVTAELGGDPGMIWTRPQSSLTPTDLWLGPRISYGGLSEDDRQLPNVSDGLTAIEQSSLVAGPSFQATEAVRPQGSPGPSQNSALEHLFKPDLSAVALVSVLLLAALVLERCFRRIHPCERHRVLVTAAIATLAALLLHALVRTVVRPEVVTHSWFPAELGITLGVVSVIGSIALAGRLLLGSHAIVRMQRVAEPYSDDDPVQRRAMENAIARVRLDQAPAVYFSDRCDAPFVTGFRTHRVFLPRHLREGSEAELSLVLFHEFAHVQRRDCAAETALQLLGTLLWWNPLYWVLARRIRSMRERACDRIAAAWPSDPKTYAELLVRYASSSRLPIGQGFAAVRMADRNSLFRRLDELLKADDSRWLAQTYLSARVLMPWLSALVLCVVPLDAGVPQTFERMRPPAYELSFCPRCTEVSAALEPGADWAWERLRAEKYASLQMDCLCDSVKCSLSPWLRPSFCPSMHAGRSLSAGDEPASIIVQPALSDETIIEALVETAIDVIEYLF